MGTVDQFQGRDKLVVIYSCTRSNSGNKEEGVRSGHILMDSRRLNVAVTRARAKLKGLRIETLPRPSPS